MATCTLACVCVLHLSFGIWRISMSRGQVSDLLMDIKRSWPVPHQNPSWTPTPLTYTPRFVPCERMWPGSHPRGGVNLNDGLLRHIAQLWASLSSWPSLPIGSGPPGPPLKRPIVWHGFSGDNVPCLHTMAHAVLCGAPASTFSQSQYVELAIKAWCNWWETCRFCAVYNIAQRRSMCLHQRRQLCTMEQKHCQSQSNGCAQRWGGGDLWWLGEEFVCPECSKGMQRSNVGRQRLRTGGGWQCVAFGKIRIGKEWTCCLLIEWTQELQKSLIKQEVLSNHCSLPLFHNQERNYNAAWQGLHIPFTATQPQKCLVFMQPYCLLTNKHLSTVNTIMDWNKVILNNDLCRLHSL